MLSNQALKSCASDVTLYYPLKRSSPPLCFSFNQISSRIASWQTNSENDRNFFKKMMANKRGYASSRLKKNTGLLKIL